MKKLNWAKLYVCEPNNLTVQWRTHGNSQAGRGGNSSLSPQGTTEDRLRMDIRYKLISSSKGQWEKLEAKSSPGSLVCYMNGSRANGKSGTGV